MAENINNVAAQPVTSNQNANTAVATQQNTSVGFNVSANMEALKIAMSEENAGLEFTFDKIKLPAGGGIAFEVPTPNSADPELMKEVIGVIVHNHQANTYYSAKYDGTTNPPDCHSIDGVVGHGNPGGECKNCPFNKYGTDSAGKACKNKRMLYVMLEGQIFPYMFNLPVGSIQGYTNYVKALLTRGKKVSNVVTKFSLKKATNKAGIVYSQAVFTYVRDLTNEEISSMVDLKDMVKNYALTHTPAIVDAMNEGNVSSTSGDPLQGFQPIEGANDDEELPFN